ncbi:MAG: serine hydrolase, partial [Phycisphaerales bacterium]|nr:serine hydrolase [Phycisphaerales bacterium]
MLKRMSFMARTLSSLTAVTECSGHNSCWTTTVHHRRIGWLGGVNVPVVVGMLMFASVGFAQVFPGTTWEFRTPTQVGVDGAKLDQFATNVGGNGCIVYNGYMIKTWGSQTSKADWASAAKPVISTMLLFAVKENKLSSVDALIGDWNWSLVTKDQPMTFRHLANMTGNYTRSEAPGTAWAYNDYAIQLYQKTLFDRVYGTTPNTAATHSSRLGALQFQDGTLFSSRNGYGVYTSVRDFARIGWFWLNKGNWNGNQLLPASYFDTYRQPGVPGNLPRTCSSCSTSDYLGIGTSGGGSDQTPYGPGIYGFNWWFNNVGGVHPASLTWPDAPLDTYQANGHWNTEVVTVIPSLNLVVSAIGNWGSFEPGNASSNMNLNLKLLTEAVADIQPPSVPTNVQAAAHSSSSISLTWTASTDNIGVLGYKIYRNGGGQPVGTTVNTSYIDTGLLPETTYSYTVSAYDAADNHSAQSSPAAVATTQVMPQYCSVDLGATDIENLLSHIAITGGDGDTTWATVGGLECRRPVDTGDHYFYFNINDYYMYDESGTTRYLEVRYFDDQPSSVFLRPQYDSTSAAYTDASEVYFTNTGKWRTATWTLTNCKFANRQNLGADIRLFFGPNDVKIDMVRLSTAPFPTPALGQIVVDHDNPAWFRYYGSGPFYMCGPGDPEGFLYRGTRNSDGTRNGDQMTLINKMIGTGANCIYLMAIRSHGGDGDSTHNPYINSNLSAGLSDPILNQWETWFTAMDNNGITIFFVFYDDDAKPFGRELPAGGDLLPAETVFIDTMVSRFKHHKHLIWCIAEEYIEGLSGARAVKVAQRIRAQDDRQHPIAIHQNESTSFDFNGSPYFDQFAVQ